LAAIATATITLFLYRLAKKNLEKLNETSQKESIVNAHRFLNEFSSDFFSNRTMLLFDLIEYDANKKDDNHVFILIDNEDIVYFKIVLDNLHVDLRCNYKDALQAEYGYEKNIFTTSEIDNLLLGHLEEIGIYRNRHLLDDETIYETFAYYIQLCHGNEPLMAYIKLARAEDTDRGKRHNPNYDSDLYNNFYDMHKMCEEHEKSKMTRTQYNRKIL
jgi:hypothetical protein